MMQAFGVQLHSAQILLDFGDILSIPLYRFRFHTFLLPTATKPPPVRACGWTG